MVRGPPAPARMSIGPAFTSGRVFTTSVAPYDDVVSVSSMAPLFTRPFVPVRFAPLTVPFPSTARARPAPDPAQPAAARRGGGPGGAPGAGGRRRPRLCDGQADRAAPDAERLARRV